MSELDQGMVEQEMRDLEKETSDESKQQYLIAQSKKDAVNSSHYEKI